MVLMAGFDLPVRAIREQVASAIDIVIQVDRTPDGRRVVTSMTELQGMEGDTILLQDIFTYRVTPTAEPGKPMGQLVPTGLRPKLVDELAEKGILLPAAAFRSPAPLHAATPPVGGRGRPRVPDARELVEREHVR
jgi:pilus assembly protein CpaF